MKSLIIFCLSLIPFSGLSQKIFSEENLVAVVRKYHPVARQAQLNIQMAKANITASRSAFDPVLTFNNHEKQFDGITYYNERSTAIRIPTWYGIDIDAGVETIDGSRLNPEDTKGKLHYAGLSFPLLQNLVIDKRRAALKQASLVREQSEVNTRKLINDLLQEALLSYWDWWGQHQMYKLVGTATENARQRLRMVTTAYRLGDRPAIDTLEAITQVQWFEQKESEVWMELVKSRLQLSAFLWKDDQPADILAEDVAPQKEGNGAVPLLDSLMMLATIHPSIIDYDYQLSALQIEKKLKFQALLPDLKVKYNQIGRDISGTLKSPFFQNNYRFGVSMAMPLRLSEGRGAYQHAKLKIAYAALGQANKEVEIQNKLKQFYTEWQQTLAQQHIQRSLANNYRRLQKGEEIKFENGESSLFMVNARELKTIEGEQKLLQLNVKMRLAEIMLKWAAGVLY